MRSLSASAVVLLFAVAASAHAGTPSKPGNYDQTIDVGGTERQYILHIPKGYDGTKAMPLVVVAHGHGQTAAALQKSTEFDAIADKEGFFVVYAQSTRSDDGSTAWNTGITPHNAVTVDDVGYFSTLIESLKTQLKVKAKRVYITGFSNGAMMCHRLAVELPDVFAAAACVAGTVGTSQDSGATWAELPTPKAPISIMIMHGKADNTVPYDGASGSKTVKSFDETRKFWKTANKCSGKPTKTTSNAGNIITQTFSNTACSSGKTVVAVTGVSGTHVWPRLDNSWKYDGSKRIWKFFSSKSL